MPRDKTSTVTIIAARHCSASTELQKRIAGRQKAKESLYIDSRKAENSQEGGRCIPEPGDAILVRSGKAHTHRNTGDKDLRILGFVAAAGGEIGSFGNLPLPERTSDWE